jgi:hypothetical protein
LVKTYADCIRRAPCHLSHSAGSSAPASSRSADTDLAAVWLERLIFFTAQLSVVTESARSPQYRFNQPGR